MKTIKRRIIRLLLVVALGVSGSLAGCSDDINNYEKELGSEASNKVFFSEKYVSLNFEAQRSMEGVVTNMDTLIAKLVVNCNEPAGNNLKVKINLDTLLVDVYNSKNETDYIQFNTACIKVNKKELTIEEGNTESTDTLIVSLAKSLDAFGSQRGYILPVCITSASGYDAQVDYSKRVSYLTLDVVQENGVGFKEGQNVSVTEGNDDFAAGYDFPLVAYLPSEGDIRIELEVDNSLVDAFNKENGTDFKTISSSDLELDGATLPAGSTEVSARIAYKGDVASLAGRNYLIPVRIKSVSSESEIKTLSTDVYYWVVNAVSDWMLVEDDTALGIQQTDRTGYKAIASEKTEFMVGNWESMFKDQQWVTKESPRSVVVDLGNEVRNITGIYIQAGNPQMPPISINISYAGEKLHTDYPSMGISLGTMELPRQKDLYFKFDKPVDARYIGLNNMAGVKNGFYSFIKFYIYTKN